MSKLLVETTGSFMLVDPNNGKTIRHEGATVVEKTGFIEERITDLIVHCEVPAEASDADWLDVSKECGDDFDLARDSFLSLYGDKPKSKGKGKSKATAEDTVEGDA